MSKLKIVLATLVLSVVGLAFTAAAAQQSAQPCCDPVCCASCDCCV